MAFDHVSGVGTFVTVRNKCKYLWLFLPDESELPKGQLYCPYEICANPFGYFGMPEMIVKCGLGMCKGFERRTS